MLIAAALVVIALVSGIIAGESAAARVKEMGEGRVEMGEVEKEVKAHHDLLDEEDRVREKVDAQGNKWRKVYFGGGPHFQNWLAQTIELCGKRNVRGWYRTMSFCA
jgi:hypothetical protein